MGYSTILDIIGSTVIGGMLLLILLRTNSAAVENTLLNGQDLNVQQNLTTIVEVLEHDFRKIGYCKDWKKIENPNKVILSADSSSIKYLTDINNNGNLDSLYYYLGPASELQGTSNPRDRLLYRVINNETPRSANLGVTEFKLLYFDSSGDTLHFPINYPGNISSIQISIRVENTEAYDNKYTSGFWRQIRMTVPNLSKR